jgi:hypothetical protein
MSKYRIPLRANMRAICYALAFYSTVIVDVTYNKPKETS